MPEQNQVTATGAESQETVNAEPQSTGQDVNKIVQDRLARQQRAFEREKAQLVQQAREAVLDEIGAPDDDIDALRSRLEKAQDGQSESKKLEREYKKLQKLHADAEAKAAAYEAAQKKVIIRDAIRKAAGESAHTESVIAMLAYQGGLDLDADNNVLVNNAPLDDAVKQLLSANPHLVKPTSPAGGSGSRPGTGKSSETQHDLNTPAGRMALLAEKGYEPFKR